MRCVYGRLACTPAIMSWASRKWLLEIAVMTTKRQYRKSSHVHFVELFLATGTDVVFEILDGQIVSKGIPDIRSQQNIRGWGLISPSLGNLFTWIMLREILILLFCNLCIYTTLFHVDCCMTCTCIIYKCIQLVYNWVNSSICKLGFLELWIVVRWHVGLCMGMTHDWTVSVYSSAGNTYSFSNRLNYMYTEIYVEALGRCVHINSNKHHSVTWHCAIMACDTKFSSTPLYVICACDC